jgi:V8-like Glu-specific endopeptidase
MKEFVFPTVDDMNDGCGVLVGSLFVTAAHVVQEHDFYLFINGKNICLKKEDALLFKYKQAEDGADIAVFRLEGYKSPLEFDTSSPQTDMLLDSISYEHMVEGSSNLENIFLDEPKEWYKLIECQATINELAGNFYQCKTSVILKPGSSGSPVFRNGKVFGILHGGQVGTNLCVFQSSCSILSLMRQTEAMKSTII